VLKRAPFSAGATHTTYARAGSPATPAVGSAAVGSQQPVHASQRLSSCAAAGTARPSPRTRERAAPATRAADPYRVVVIVPLPLRTGPGNPAEPGARKDRCCRTPRTS